MTLKVSHSRPKTLTFVALLLFIVFLIIGIVAVWAFAVNVRAMLLLKGAFDEANVWQADFESITCLMIARMLSPITEDVSSFHNMDFFKLTAGYVRANNSIALWLAVTATALVNFSGALRRIPKLRVAATFVFGSIALASPIIVSLSGSYAGF